MPKNESVPTAWSEEYHVRNFVRDGSGPIDKVRILEFTLATWLCADTGLRVETDTRWVGYLNCPYPRRGWKFEER